MRRGLSGLTSRGRSFLAAGLTAICCAIVLGQPALTRVGVLLVALPLLCAVLVGRNRYQLALSRTLSPGLVSAGAPATVQLTLRNEGRIRTGLLLVEDQLPYALGNRPRFVVDGLKPQTPRTTTYQVRSDVRGNFVIGPLLVRINDPFGMVELGRSFHASTNLVVTPRITPLPPIPIGGAWTGAGDNRPRAFATGSAEDVSVREYRRGDDLRRVHWRSSARTGELMVRREEQPWQSRATLVLDNRATAHRGTGAASSLEAAVAHTASIAAHLTQRGFTVRLVTADGEDPNSVWHDRSRGQDVSPILEALAVLETTRRAHLATDWIADAGHQGVLIAVLGELDDHDHGALRRMRISGRRPLAMTLDVNAWTQRNAAPAGRAAWLSSLGWAAIDLRPGDALAPAWQELGRRADRPTGAPVAERSAP
ncbi:DUF58 domain-containing protein [Nocardioides sp. Bht2]|uniref:DUF58 domain-containing protein n=1 Tax=Nocardioides sp. Bht2 TaxID=3392297 RepID=UPI0039B5345D